MDLAQCDLAPYQPETILLILPPDVQPNGQGVILSVGGEVDLATAPQLHAKLADLVEVGEAGSVVVDLTPVGSWTRPASPRSWPRTGRAQARGHTIRLVCPAGPVLRVLRLTGMEKVVSVYSSLAEAVAAQDADAD